MFQKYPSFLLLAIWRWNSDRGNSIFVSTFCGAWLNKVKVDWPMKNGDSSICLACIVYNWEVNSRDDNKWLIMGEKNRCRCHQSSRKTFWPTSHSDFLSCRIQESECKFTGPNKNKNNFRCLLLYQFAAILSQKYQAFPAVVAFNQGLPIFQFLF